MIHYSFTVKVIIKQYVCYILITDMCILLIKVYCFFIIIDPTRSDNNDRSCEGT